MSETVLLATAGLASGITAYHQCRRDGSEASPVLASALILIGACFGAAFATANAPTATKLMLTHLTIICLPLAAADALTGKLPRTRVLATYPSTAVVIGVAASMSSSATVVLGAVAGALGMWLLFFILACFGGLGAGDVRLAPVLGAHLGYAGILVTLSGTIAAFAFGALAVATMAAIGGGTTDRRVPFAPALLVGAILALTVSLPID